MPPVIFVATFFGRKFSLFMKKNYLGESFPPGMEIENLPGFTYAIVSESMPLAIDFKTRRRKVPVSGFLKEYTFKNLAKYGWKEMKE